MSYIALENQPIVVNLLTAADYTGWTVNGTIAIHSTCQQGNVTLLSFPVVAGQTYQVSYAVLTINSGYVQLQTPGSNGAMQTAANLYVETVTPNANGFVQFFSNANCQITSFNIRNTTNPIGTTLVFSTLNNKWSDFRNFYPDFGWSIYEQSIFGYNGALYAAQNGGGGNTNNFFGVQYQSMIKFVEAKNPGIVKDYEAISYQANMLLVSTINGIVSSLGQITTLIDTDFIKQKLASNGLSVIVYQNDNVYSASFLNDSNTDTVNGEQIRGNYIIVELVTVDASTPLTLFSVSVRSKYVPLGSR